MKCIAILLLLIRTIVPVSAQDPAAFRFKGLALGVSEGQFIDLHIKAAVSELSDRKSGIVIYKSTAEDSSPKNSTYLFLDGLLIRIDAVYSKEELDQIGGIDILIARLIERLGKPSASNTLNGHQVGNTIFLNDAFWDFDDLHHAFSISLRLVNNVPSALFYATDSHGWDEYNKRKAKHADTGF